MSIDWTAIGAGASALAVIVTLIIFMLQSSRRRRESIAKTRHESVTRVLDLMEASVRHSRRPYFLRMFSNPELEWTLLVVRLVHELGKDEESIAVWVQGQSHRMFKAASDRAALRIGIETASALVDWNRGERSTKWFMEEIHREGPVGPLRITRMQKARRAASRVWDAGKSWLVGIFIVEVARRSLVEVRELNMKGLLGRTE